MISPRCITFFCWGRDIVSRCLRGISFSVVGGETSCLDVFEVSLFPFERGNRVPIPPLYPVFRWGGGGHRVLMSPRYPLFRWGGDIVSRCLRVIPFPVLGGRGESCPDVPAVYILSQGGGPYSDISSVSLFPLGGGHRVRRCPRCPCFVAMGGHCTRCPSAFFFLWGKGHRVPMSPRYSFFR